MKVLFVYDSGSNCIYLRRMLDLQVEMFKDFSYTLVRLPQYIHFNQDDFDILIYQTFPDETHPFKFDIEMVKKADDRFLAFKGKRILMDSFDNGSRDAFSRFKDLSKEYPRIKTVPSWSMLENFNIIFSVPPYFGADTIEPVKDSSRDIMAHFAPTLDVGIYSHDIRKGILDILRNNFNGECNLTRIPRRSYPDFLRRVQISITGPAFGPCSNTFWTAMQYGALSMAEETVDDYKLLSKVDLIQGEDYVSFSLNFLVNKLRYLFKNPHECERIRKSGQRKFQEGYNLPQSARDFHQVLESL